LEFIDAVISSFIQEIYIDPKTFVPLSVINFDLASVYINLTPATV